MVLKINMKGKYVKVYRKLIKKKKKKRKLLYQLYFKSMIMKMCGIGGEVVKCGGPFVEPPRFHCKGIDSISGSGN